MMHPPSPYMRKRGREIEGNEAVINQSKVFEAIKGHPGSTPRMIMEEMNIKGKKEIETSILVRIHSCALKLQVAGKIRIRNEPERILYYPGGE